MPDTQQLQPISDPVTLFAIDVLVASHKYPVGSLIENEAGSKYEIFVGTLGKLVLHVKQENGVIVPISAKLSGKLLPVDVRPPASWDDLKSMYIYMAQIRVYCYMKINFA